MNYNLTPSQREGLKWVVEQVRAGEIEESFLVGWVNTGIIISDCLIENFPEKTLKKGNFDAWELAGLVTTSSLASTSNWSNLSLWCTLTQAAYDAVDSNFRESDTPPNTGRLLSFLSDHFNIEELRTLATLLGVDHEDIAGVSKTSYARELIDHMENRGLLWELIRTAFTLK